MMRKRVLTEKDGIFYNVLFEEGKAVSIHLEDFDESPLVGRIYTAKVMHQVRNLNACFVEYEPGKNAWVDLKKGEKLNPGDSVPICMTREAVGSKPPRASLELTVSDSLAVLVYGSSKASVSSKIAGERREELKALAAPYLTEKCGFILRSACETAPDSEIVKQLERMSKHAEILERSFHLLPYSHVYEPPASWLMEIRDRDLVSETEIITDLPDVYQHCVEEFPDAKDRFRLYEDDALSLFRLMSLEKVTEEALKEKVYLKSGGNLVIQPTEAMTVIDVNSARAVGNNREKEENTLKVNLEAAEECARQLRLRNLSGIIVIDFIDQKRSENEELIIRRIKELLKKDSVKADFVEMTKLHFAVLTRQRIRAPFSQEWREKTQKLREKTLDRQN